MDKLKQTLISQEDARFLEIADLFYLFYLSKMPVVTELATAVATPIREISYR